MAALAAAFLLAVLALRAFTDEARIKAWIQGQARTHWGLEVTLDRLSWSLRPMPTLRATQVLVAETDGEQQRSLLSAAKLSIQLELWPLLHKRVEADTLSMEGFRIQLKTQPDEPQVASRQNGKPPSSDQATPPLANLHIKQLILRDGWLIHADANQEPRRWHVREARVDAQAGWRKVALQATVERAQKTLKLAAHLDDASRLGMPGATSKGKVQLEIGPASLEASGILPLDSGLKTYDLDARLAAASLDDAFDFLGFTQRPHAPLAAKGHLRASDGATEVSGLDLQLGKAHITGDVRIDKTKTRPVFTARLDADRVDWVQVRQDIGLPALPPKPKGELFYDLPLPWAQLRASKDIEGTWKGRLGWLKLRSGAELSDVDVDLSLSNGKLHLHSFNAQLLGGTATGNALLDGAAQSAQVELHLKNTQLGTWLSQTHKKVPFTGGRMQLDAKVSATGSSMKKLAGTMSGPVKIDIGTATIHSKKLGETETLFVGLTPFFSAKDTEQVDLRCASGFLPFHNGVARADNIIGVRSEASQLLTSGAIDFRRQTLDLHGTIRARAGITLGVSNFADKIKIEGPILSPKVGLDESNAPGALARVAAAIFTGGTSLIGTAIWDGIQAAPNPCEQALAKAGSSQIKSTRKANTHNAKKK